jgi:hypothetical protein
MTDVKGDGNFTESTDENLATDNPREVVVVGAFPLPSCGNKFFVDCTDVLLYVKDRGVPPAPRICIGKMVNRRMWRIAVTCVKDIVCVFISVHGVGVGGRQKSKGAERDKAVKWRGWRSPGGAGIFDRAIFAW